MDSKDFLLWHPSYDPCRVSCDDHTVRNILHDDGSCPYERVFSDRDPRQKDAPPTDAGGPQNAWCGAHEGQVFSAMTNPLIVHRRHTGTAEHFIFNDNTSRYVAGALQGNMISDGNLAFDVYVGTYGASFTDAGIASNEDKVSQTCPFTNRNARENYTKLSLLNFHKPENLMVA
jgi:hypothetical protein